jgi:hypothetical protein
MSSGGQGLQEYVGTSNRGFPGSGYIVENIIVRHEYAPQGCLQDLNLGSMVAEAIFLMGGSIYQYRALIFSITLSCSGLCFLAYLSIALNGTPPSVLASPAKNRFLIGLSRPTLCINF